MSDVNRNAAVPPAGASARAAWIERVLGVSPSGAAARGGDWAAFAVRLRAARDGWQQASEATDHQINTLRDVLRGLRDPAMHEIADKGLNALTEGFKVKLLAAMVGLGDTQGPAQSRQLSALADAASGFRTFLESDERVAACDECPHTPIAIRDTLAPALRRLEATVANAPRA